MNKNRKILTIALMLLLIAMPAVALVDAQDTATVTVLEVTGGTTDVTGTTTYPDGTAITITATPDDGFAFNGWTVATDAGDSYNSMDNPLSFSVAAGVTYAVQPDFAVIQAIPGSNMPQNIASAATVVILPSAGGTTSPAPGTYALSDASSFNLTAMANNGWQFSHWTISGTSTNHGGAPVNWSPTDNPYNVNHGYGYTYYYQAVFVQSGSSEPTPTPASGGGMGGIDYTWIIIGLVVVIIVLLVGFGIYVAKRKK